LSRSGWACFRRPRFSGYARARRLAKHFHPASGSRTHEGGLAGAADAQSPTSAVEGLAESRNPNQHHRPAGRHEPHSVGLDRDRDCPAVRFGAHPVLAVPTRSILAHETHKGPDPCAASDWATGWPELRLTQRGHAAKRADPPDLS